MRPDKDEIADCAYIAKILTLGRAMTKFDEKKLIDLVNNSIILENWFGTETNPRLRASVSVMAFCIKELRAVMPDMEKMIEETKVLAGALTEEERAEVARMVDEHMNEIYKEGIIP